MDQETPKMCTTSGRPVDVVRAEQTEKVGQHKDYIVLCDEERQKGFVRPYRDAYRHSGGETPCKRITTMGRSLAETYARDPKFYGSTFCTGCNTHLPVAEFNWYEMDGTEGPTVGS